jgi:hypothetical protein
MLWSFESRQEQYTRCCAGFFVMRFDNRMLQLKKQLRRMTMDLWRLFRCYTRSFKETKNFRASKRGCPTAGSGISGNYKQDEPTIGSNFSTL